MHKQEVIIITLNYNQSDMTIECLNSILNADFENYKILLIDNGSRNEEFMKLDYFSENSKVILERISKNCGYVGGINFGMKVGLKYDPKYFLIMNNDTIIANNAISELVKTADKYEQNAIVSGKIYHFDQPNVIQHTGSNFIDKRYLKETYPGKDEKDIGQCDKEEERDMLDDIFWLLPVEVYNQIGGYSNHFFLYAEQADYALRAKMVGVKLIYTPKAKLWHKASTTTGGGNRYAPSVNFWRNKSSIIYLFRNTKKIYFINYILNTLPKLFIKHLLNILKLRKSTDPKSDYAALVGHLSGIKWTFRKREESGHNPFNS